MRRSTWNLAQKKILKDTIDLMHLYYMIHYKIKSSGVSESCKILKLMGIHRIGMFNLLCNCHS